LEHVERKYVPQVDQGSDGCNNIDDDNSYYHRPRQS
jgi:hypothetical protein